MSTGENLSRSAALRFEPAGSCAAIPVAAGWEAGISLLSAGDMALSKRALLPWRARFLSERGIPAERAMGLHQVHSRNVVVIENQTPEECAHIEADGMVTDRSGLALTVTVADCLPIFLTDTKRGAFGIVHSGWKGTGVALDALRIMNERFGSSGGSVAHHRAGNRSLLLRGTRGARRIFLTGVRRAERGAHPGTGAAPGPPRGKRRVVATRGSGGDRGDHRLHALLGAARVLSPAGRR